MAELKQKSNEAAKIQIESEQIFQEKSKTKSWQAIQRLSPNYVMITWAMQFWNSKNFRFPQRKCCKNIYYLQTIHI